MSIERTPDPSRTSAASGGGASGSASGGAPGELERVIGPGGAVLLGLGAMVGTGVFVSLGLAAGAAGPWFLPAILLAGLLALCNGLSSASLAAQFPTSGGTYEYGRRMLGPASGFAAGWLFLSAKSASAAAAGLGLAGYLLESAGWNEVWLRAAGGFAFAFAIAALAASGLRRSNRINAILVFATGAVLLTFAGAVGFAVLSAGWPPSEAALVGAELAEILDGSAFFPFEPIGFLTATGLVFVAFTGYGRVATLGEEVRDPARVIPRSIARTVGVAALLYILTGLAAWLVLGSADYARAAREAAPLELAARRLGLSWLQALLAAGAALALAGVILNLVLGLSRVLLAMARQNDAPSSLAVLSSRGRGPVRATLAMGLVVAGIALLGDVASAWSFSAAAVLLYYALTNLAALRLPRETRRLATIVPVLGLLGCLVFFAFVDWRSILQAGIVLLIGFGLRALTRGLPGRSR